MPHSSWQSLTYRARGRAGPFLPIPFPSSLGRGWQIKIMFTEGAPLRGLLTSCCRSLDAHKALSSLLCGTTAGFRIINWWNSAPNSHIPRRSGPILALSSTCFSNHHPFSPLRFLSPLLLTGLTQSPRQRQAQTASPPWSTEQEVMCPSSSAVATITGPDCPDPGYAEKVRVFLNLMEKS